MKTYGMILFFLFALGCTESDETTKRYTELNVDSLSLATEAMFDLEDIKNLLERGKYDEALAKCNSAEEKLIKSTQNLKEMCELAEGREDLDCPSHLINEKEQCLARKTNFLCRKIQWDKEKSQCSDDSCLSELKERCFKMANEAMVIDAICIALDPEQGEMYDSIVEQCELLN